MVATVYLWKTGRKIIYTLIPMVFIIFVTMLSLAWNFKVFADNPLLIGFSAIILALAIWLVLEGYFAIGKTKSEDSLLSKELNK